MPRHVGFQSARRERSRRDRAAHGARDRSRQNVSIRAPGTFPARLQAMPAEIELVFQSARRERSRRDAMPAHEAADGLFQSARRERSRRDSNGVKAQLRCHSVSIRAPGTFPARRVAHGCMHAVELFQSARRERSRRDAGQATDQPGGMSFNPRAGNVPGATNQTDCTERSSNCFNPRAGNVPGATCPVCTASAKIVSIRAPGTFPARRLIRPNDHLSKMFQSARRERSRRDVHLTDG